MQAATAAASCCGCGTTRCSLSLSLSKHLPAHWPRPAEQRGRWTERLLNAAPFILLPAAIPMACWHIACRHAKRVLCPCPSAVTMYVRTPSISHPGLSCSQRAAGSGHHPTTSHHICPAHHMYTILYSAPAVPSACSPLQPRHTHAHTLCMVLRAALHIITNAISSIGPSHNAKPLCVWRTA